MPPNSLLPRKWQILKLICFAESRPVDLGLAFLILVLKGSMGVQSITRCFSALDEPKMPFVIRWQPG
jgi:hypothetical protein